MRHNTRFLACLVTVLAVGFGPNVSAQANLLPNAEFEESVLEPDVAGDPLQDVVVQPVLPEGWVFEGVAGLFDYGSDDADVLHVSPSRERNGRFIGISNTASLKPEDCSTQGQTGQCTPLPTETAKGALRPWYEVNPHWRNAQPVPVTTGRSYGLSFHVAGELLTTGTGPRSAVRWLDANGLTIEVASGPSFNSEVPDCMTGEARVNGSCPWKFLSNNGQGLVAPPGATSAIVLLGHSSDISLGQVRFDGVFFG